MLHKRSYIIYFNLTLIEKLRTNNIEFELVEKLGQLRCTDPEYTQQSYYIERYSIPSHIFKY